MAPADLHATDRIGILLVDDVPSNLTTMQAVLDDPDYDLVLASSGEQALGQLLRHDFAVILLDVAMPGMDGFETAAIIKQRERSSATPIVFVTASVADIHDLAQAYGTGAADYLQKPFDPFVLRAKVAIFAQLFRHRRELERQTRLLRESDRRRRDLESARLRLASEVRHQKPLAAQYEVVSVLALATSLEEVALKVLEAVGTNLGWDVATLWVHDRTGTLLQPVAVWSGPSGELDAFADATRASTCRRGEGLPGWVWQTGEPVRVGDLPAASRLERREAARASGLATGLWVPIPSGGEVLGVLELVAQTARHSDDILTTIVTLAGQIGLFAERARAIAALADGEERLFTTLRSIDEAVLATDEAGRMTFVNAAAEALTGWTEDEARDVELDEVLHLVDERTGAKIENPVPRVIRSGGAVAISEHAALVSRSGAQRSIEDSAAPIRNARGELSGVVLVLRDVTERRREAERRRVLAEASEILHASLDYEEVARALARLAVPKLADWCVVHLLGDDGSPHAIGLAHVDPERLEPLRELAGRNLGDAEGGHPVLRAIQTRQPASLQEDAEALPGKFAAGAEGLDLLRRVGLCSVMVVPLVARGRAFGAVTFAAADIGRTYVPADLAVAEDLARRAAVAIDNGMLYAESRAAIHLRDEFLSIASHELRTPLTALQLQLESLQRRTGGDAASAAGGRYAERIENAVRQVRRLADLIDRLLDVTRLSAGRIELRVDECELGEIARDVALRLRDEAARGGSEIHVSADAPASGRWDRMRIEQVLYNLLSNAVKYGAGKPIDVTVGSDDRMASLSVRDRGIGVPEQDLARIFGRFERAVSPRHYGGLGLGLYIVRQIVEAHGGRVVVTSAAGAGSTFTVVLPRRPVEVSAREGARTAA